MKKSRKEIPPSSRARNPRDAAIQQRIGEELRVMYDGVTKEPIPDKFLKLLDELEAKDRARDE